MTRTLQGLLGKPISRRTFGVAATAALASAVTPFHAARAQGKTLKIGVLLPRSGVQAQIGQSCQRGVEIAPGLLRDMGYTEPIQILSADTQTSVDVARNQAERLIAEGANLLIGAFDSGQTSAIAQVCEQHAVPFVINVGAAPQITEQGYQYVVRNFPTAPQLVTRGLSRIKDLLAATGANPKTAVYMHINDTFGMAVKGAIEKIVPHMNFPFKIVEEIAYDPAARDLSVEVAKAKASGADLLLVTTRLNDAILLIREMVKQRWSPMGVVSPGSPGMYEEAFYDTLGRYSDYCISNVPWVNPKERMTQMVIAEFKKRYPNDRVIGHIFNVSFTFEALLVAADGFKRAQTTAGAPLAQALRATHIEHHITLGGPIQFDAKGQNNGVESACMQNRGGQPVVTLPPEAAELPPVLPMPTWESRA